MTRLIITFRKFAKAPKQQNAQSTLRVAELDVMVVELFVTADAVSQFRSAFHRLCFVLRPVSFN